MQNNTNIPTAFVSTNTDNNTTETAQRDTVTTTVVQGGETATMSIFRPNQNENHQRNNQVRQVHMVSLILICLNKYLFPIRLTHITNATPTTMTKAYLAQDSMEDEVSNAQTFATDILLTQEGATDVQIKLQPNDFGHEGTVEELSENNNNDDPKILTKILHDSDVTESAYASSQNLASIRILNPTFRAGTSNPHFRGSTDINVKTVARTVRG